MKKWIKVMSAFLAVGAMLGVLVGCAESAPDQGESPAEVEGAADEQAESAGARGREEKKK